MVIRPARVRVRATGLAARAIESRDRHADPLGVNLQLRAPILSGAQVVEIVLLHVKQERINPAARLALIRPPVRFADPEPSPATGNESSEGGMVVMQSNADLLQIVLASCAVS